MSAITGYIIHLERATARAAHVAELIATLPCPAEIVPAVDADALSPADRARYDTSARLRPRYPFPLAETEIAVFLSHRAAWDRIAGGTSEAGLIIEDDVALEPDTFDRAFDLALAHASDESWIRLPWKPREAPAQMVAEDAPALLFYPRRVALGMQAQIVGRRAAERLLTATERFDRPVDTTLQMTWHTGVTPMVVWPSGIHDISADLGGSTLSKRPRSTSQRLLAEVKRGWYRAALALR
ncbi:MAG: glycosyltransferase family 25 protein [Pseudomonadota bacterium]